MGRAKCPDLFWAGRRLNLSMNITWPEMPDKWSDRTPLQKMGTVFINAMGIIGLVGIVVQILFPVEPFTVHDTYD